MSEFVQIDDIPTVPIPLDALEEPASPSSNGAGPITVETWREFAEKSSDEIPCLVEGLWPEGAVGFIASPPKKGKTWLAIGLALSVATGNAFLSTFPVSRPRSVIYAALEGHRSALTHRIAALARGQGTDPDNPIENLHLIYKPRGMNLASPEWAQRLADAAETVEAELVIVDVLRAAALLKENSAEDFARLVSTLSPVLAGGRSLAFLHHFTKLSETSKERDPGERMSGSGAMYGALDVGIYITGSERGARKLRLAFETRDISSPPGIGVELVGDGTGRNGGLTYRDKAFWSAADAPDEDDVDVSAEDIRDWILELEDRTATTAMIEAHFEISDKTVGRRRARLDALGVHWKRGTGHRKGVYIATVLPPAERDQLQLPDPDDDIPIPSQMGVENELL